MELQGFVSEIFGLYEYPRTKTHRAVSRRVTIS